MTDADKQEEKAAMEHLQKVMKARAAIVAALGGPWKKGKPGSRGDIDCPICHARGALYFVRAGINGHIHAACKTADCVSWLE